MNDADINEVLEDIRRRGEAVLDRFEELLLNDAELNRVLPHLEEMKRQQDDVLTVLKQIGDRKSQSKIPNPK